MRSKAPVMSCALLSSARRDGGADLRDADLDLVAGAGEALDQLDAAARHLLDDALAGAAESLGDLVARCSREPVTLSPAPLTAETTRSRRRRDPGSGSGASR